MAPTLARRGSSDRLTKSLGWLCAISFVPAAVGLLILTPRSNGAWLTLLVIALAGALIALQRHRRALPRVCLLAVVLNLLVVGPEVWLRVADFRYESGIDIGYTGFFERLQRDPDLFWTLPPRDGVNSLGFRGEEVTPRESATRYRILFLGDSVPGQGYPDLVQALLQRKWDVEVLNFSLVGFSSYQGRVLAEKYAELIDPDAVVVSYGWNDHWLAPRERDSARRSPRLTGGAFFESISSSRLVQLARRATGPLLEDRTEPRLRVTQEEYRDNLRAIGCQFASTGAAVVLITAPGAHQVQGVPDYLVEAGFAADEQSVVELHRRYNQEVRNVASREGWWLLDLEHDLGQGPRLETLFSSDGIHLTDAGLQEVAQHVARLFDRTHLLGAREDEEAGLPGSTLRTSGP